MPAALQVHNLTALPPCCAAALPLSRSIRRRWRCSPTTPSRRSACMAAPTSTRERGEGPGGAASAALPASTRRRRRFRLAEQLGRPAPYAWPPPPLHCHPCHSPMQRAEPAVRAVRHSGGHPRPSDRPPGELGAGSKAAGHPHAGGRARGRAGPGECRLYRFQGNSCIELSSCSGSARRMAPGSRQRRLPSIGPDLAACGALLWVLRRCWMKQTSCWKWASARPSSASWVRACCSCGYGAPASRSPVICVWLQRALTFVCPCSSLTTSVLLACNPRRAMHSGQSSMPRCPSNNVPPLFPAVPGRLPAALPPDAAVQRDHAAGSAAGGGAGAQGAALFHRHDKRGGLGHQRAGKAEYRANLCLGTRAEGRFPATPLARHPGRPSRVNPAPSCCRAA